MEADPKVLVFLCIEEDDPFIITMWLDTIELIVMLSVEKWDALKDKVKCHLPSQYSSGEVITTKLSKNFQHDAKELSIAGEYDDHKHTLKMLQIFLFVGGDGHEGEEYNLMYCHFHHNNKKHAKLTEGLKAFLSMQHNDASHHLVNDESLSFKHSCHQAAGAWAQKNVVEGCWMPGAKHATNGTKAILCTFTNLSSQPSWVTTHYSPIQSLSFHWQKPPFQWGRTWFLGAPAPERNPPPCHYTKGCYKQPNNTSQAW